MRKGKRHISLFLAIVMCFILLQAPIQLIATEVATRNELNSLSSTTESIIDSDITPDIYVDDVKASTGGNVTVPLILGNDIDTDSIKLEIGWDANVLKPLNITNSNIFKDTRLDAEESSYILSYKGSATETGALANIEFSVNSEATISDSSVSVTVKNAMLDGNDITQSISSSNGVVKIEDNNLTIDGATLSVSSDITVKYLLKKTAFDNAGYKDPYIEATYCGKTTKLDALVTSVSGIECYVFSFNNVAPHKMNDSIYTVLYAQKDGELCSGQTHEYSVAKYAYSKLATTTDPYFRTMLVDMLNYGAAAQKYMNYNINALVNADLTEKQQSYGTQNLRELTTVKYLPTAEASDKANWVGLGLYLENKVAIRGYFDTDLTNGIYVKVTDEAGKTLGTVPYSDLTTAIGPDNTPVYTFIFDGLNVSQMSKVVKFSICDANNNTISRAYTYSIESYVYTSKDSSVEKLANLTKEMIKYGDAAEKYVSSRGTIFGNMTVADLGEVMYARIVNTGTNTTLDVSGEDVLLKTSAGEIGQIWKFEQNSDGTYTIINQANGKMLNVDNGAEASGANISVCTRTDAVSGKWYILTDGKDYAFMPVYSDAYVMSVADNNAFLEAYTKSGLNYKFNILKLIIENNRENVIWNTTPAIPADSGNVIKLSDYHIQFAQNENITAASEITWTSDELEITNNKVTIPSKGVYKLTAKSGTKTKTVYIVAKNASETEYVLYYNDFSSSSLSDFRSFSGDGTMSVSNGRLVLSGKKCILLPEYIGDFADYTITSNSTITAANNNTRWMGIMYRKLDGSAPYYQFSTRKNAADERGIELVENNGFGTWTYQQVGSFSEAISATKLYPYKIMVYDDTVKAYINNTLLMSYNNLSSRTGDVGLQVSDCTTEFDYLKVDLNFDIIYNYVRLAQLYSEKPVDLGADFYARFAESKSGKSLVASNDNVVIGAMSKDTNQIWRFTRNSNGSYRICHVSKNMYLSTNNSSSTAGTNVLLRAYSDSSDQAWFIYEQNNSYILVPSCSYDVAMDLAAGITTTGNNIQLWTYNDDDDNAKYFDILQVEFNDNKENTVWYDTNTISVNIRNVIDLNKYCVQFSNNGRLYSGKNILWSSSNADVVDNQLKVSSKGTYTLVAQINGFSKKFNIVYDYIQETEHSEYINYRNYLINTNKKLTEEKELSVLFYGGSLTEGHGASDKAEYSWRGRTCKWFEENFPDVNFTFHNKAVGESGTFLGTYRLKLDVIDVAPDLMFLEYSINDRYFGSSYDEALMRCETIVREIKQALPQTEIIILITTDRDCLQNNSQGSLHTQGQAHEAVAKAYDIPSLHIGMALAEKCGYSKDTFNSYAIDVVHLNDAGYAIYYACVEEYLENSLLNTDFSEVSNIQKNYPMISNALFDGNRLHIQPTQALVEASEKNGGIGVEYQNKPYTANSASVGLFILNDEGDVLVFKFTGTEIAMWCSLLNGEYLVSIDGSAYKKMTTTAHNPAVIAENLASKEHTVKIKVVKNNGFTIGSLFTRDATKATKK